ncbi:MAG TPA: DUF4142 domain-containing protein [Candidatus Sulfopaludibacter sp.]|jgi:putative membrane protein|nr:DUF4142 domain-containing protein [Candidatus Sulfopaludibacter sp.]
MYVRQSILTTLAAVTLAAGSAVAQNSADRMTSGSTFMNKAAQGGIAEVEMGRLAVQNGANEAVKNFGQRMIDDHSRANDELKQLAARKNVTLPTTPDAKEQAGIDRLGKAQGATFDREYMNMMVNDHKEDISEFEKAARTETDPDVKAFANKTLPTLREHLKLAQETLAKVR